MNINNQTQNIDQISHDQFLNFINSQLNELIQVLVNIFSYIHIKIKLILKL
jgi:hypothetical protein